jgi:hypothetical protein
MFRLLRYPYNYPAEPAVEKGVDVQLALGAVEWALDDESNIAIVLSHDNDLLPVPEAIDRLADASRVETASWVSPTYRQRLRPKGGVYHHEILKAVFDRVATPVNYARSSQS